MFARTIALLGVLSSGCIVGPKVIGETAEDGDHAAANTTSGSRNSPADRGDPGGSTQTSTAGDDDLDWIPPIPESDPCPNCSDKPWNIPLLLEGVRALELAPNSVLVVVLASAGEPPRIQRLTPDGRFWEPPQTIAVPMIHPRTKAALEYSGFAVGRTGLGALAMHTEEEYLVYGLSQELTQPLWNSYDASPYASPIETYPDFAVSSLSVASDGSTLLAFSDSKGRDEVAGFDGATGLGEGGVGAIFRFDGPNGEAGVISDPDAVDLVFWFVKPSEWEFPTTSKYYNHFYYDMDGRGGHGWDAADSVGTTRLTPVPIPDGWMQVGAASSTGGIYFLPIDSTFVAAPPVLDLPWPDDDPLWPVATAATSELVLVFAAPNPIDRDTLSVRRYDLSGALVDVVPIPRYLDEVVTRTVVDVAVGADDAVFVLGRDATADGASFHWLQRLPI